MVKWSKSLVKILIFRNVSKFVFVQILNKLKLLKVTTLSYLIKLLNATTWSYLIKVIKFVYVFNFSSYSLS